MKSRRDVLAAGAGALGVITAGCLGTSTDDWETDETIAATTATQYQGPNCNCCGRYAEYLDAHLDGGLAVETTDDTETVKAEHGIPSEYWACHTVELDGYVFEGHLPVEAIQTFLDDDPGLNGIVLPEMPAGSPGMGGEKDEPFAIYELTDEGIGDIYMEL